MEADQLTAHEMGNDAGMAEHRLWLAALALMLQDGQRFWQGLPGRSAAAEDLEEAFDALVQNTWMLRRICSYTGHSPEAISQGFNQWCESH